MRSYEVSPVRRKTLWTNLGRRDSSALAGNWPRRNNCDKKSNNSPSKWEGTSPDGKEKLVCLRGKEKLMYLRGKEKLM